MKLELKVKTFAEPLQIVRGIFFYNPSSLDSRSVVYEEFRWAFSNVSPYL